MGNENRQNSHFWSKNGHLGSGCYKFHKHANVRLLLQGISYPGRCALIFWNPHKSLLPATGQPKAAIFFQKWKFRTLRRLVDSHLRSQSSFEMRTIHKYKIYILLTIYVICIHRFRGLQHFMSSAVFFVIHCFIIILYLNHLFVGLCLSFTDTALRYT